MAAAALRVPRNVDQYRDTSLDGLIGQESNFMKANSNRRAGQHNRRSFSDSDSMSGGLPPAPEIPRGPPVAYRGPRPDESPPQRSFSQRAKARPYLKEAFADEDAADDGYVESPTYRPPRQTSRNYEPPREPRAPLHVDTLVSGARPIRLGESSAPPLMTSPISARESQRSQVHSRQVSDSAQYSDEPLSAAARSSAARDIPKRAVDDQRRDWAPDRSPLQKLEVTLNDISKEEKRARVEEAEMLLREAKAGRGGRSTDREAVSDSKQVSKSERRSSLRNEAKAGERSGLEDAGLVRNLSTTQRDRLQHSTTVDAHKPDVRRLSGDGRRGFDYEEQEYDVNRAATRKSAALQTPPQGAGDFGGQADASVRSQRRVSSGSRRLPESRIPRPVSQKQTPTDSPQVSLQPGYSEPSSPEQQIQDRSTRFPQHNPVWQNNVQSPAYAVPSSMQEKKRPVVLPNDRVAGRSNSLTKDTNSSHKAALAGAAVVGAAAAAVEPVIGRSGSKTVQKAPPQGYESAQPQRSRRFSFEPGADRSIDTQQSSSQEPVIDTRGNSVQHTAPPQDNIVQRNDIQARQAPVGLGLRQSSGTRNLDKPLPPDPSVVQRTRPPSVSFKEPFDRARPVDEWKNAGVARLTLDDFALDKAGTVNRDQTWWERNDPPSTRRRNRRTSQTSDSSAARDAVQGDDRHPEFNPPLFLRCGPLLRYTGMNRTRQDTSTSSSTPDHVVWRGSVMIVTLDMHSSYESVPKLRLYSQPKRLLSPPPHLNEGEELAPEFVDPIAGLTKISRTGRILYVRPVDHLEQGKDLSLIEDDNGLFESSPSPLDVDGGKGTFATTNNRVSDRDGQSMNKFKEVSGVRLYADPVRGVTFWRFNLEIELGPEQAHVAYRINNGSPVGFWVPSRDQSMNIMFHTCNGFSLSVDPDRFGGPDPLWRDVLNSHQTTPFHAMIGGGDQIYNDRVTMQTQYFGDWIRIRNPEHKHHAPFTTELREELETFYLERYCMWFSQGLFGMANGQIPMINIWDDHDIIDGKRNTLLSAYTINHRIGFGSYPDHFMSSPVFSGLGNIAFKYYMLFQHQSVPEEKTSDEPSWILGAKPGPYITQLSRSVFLQLGKQVAFLGIDCRTERRRDEVLTEETTDIILERCRRELVEGETKHLLVLLGIPVAYPRLVWLENLLTSRAMDPLKALGRAGVLKGGFLNKFDGGVEILDDLDDHWTASHHKHERNYLIEDLQDLAAEKSVRITILSGDVHLAAVGQFYSNPKLRIPKDHDHRYMPNIVSSAIVNTPPGDMIADVLNKRNKVHHLNKYTDEQMVPLFTHDPEEKRRNNKNLLPRRNWCSIREYFPGSTPPQTPPMAPQDPELEEEEDLPEPRRRRFSLTRDDVNPKNFFRRISQRGAPPTSYRNPADHQNPEPNTLSPIDPNCPVHGQSGSSYSQSALPNQQRESFDSAGPSQRRASFDHTSTGTPQRPTFLRRPTNLSEQAARKGNVLAVNPDGTEFDVNDHVNLEGGLDIILNCEIRQGDVAGITTPYRLLIPALWYDGSSDREKLDDAAGLNRKPTLLQRLGGARRRIPPHLEHEDAHGVQDPGDAEIFSEGEDQDRKPRRIFSLFGSRRRRRDDYQPENGNNYHNVAQGDYPGSDQLYDSETRPPSQHPGQVDRQSYVIGSPTQAQVPVAGRGPESAVMTSPPQQFLNSYHGAPPPPMSKQARLLGTGPEDHFMQPGSTPLRGNGIIGRGVDDSLTMDRDYQQYSQPLQMQHPQSPPMRYPPMNYPQSPQMMQDYSAPSAYRPQKREKRWSLKAIRDRARAGTRWDDDNQYG